MENQQVGAVHVAPGDRATFGQRPIKVQHELQHGTLFDNGALIELLTRYPRERIRVWWAGTDPTQLADWQPVDTTGVSGAEMFTCLMKGRLWINLQRVDLVDDRFARLSQGLYSSLSAQCPQFKTDYVHSYVLLSSPKAFVYLHLDSYENFFWCVRGGKTFHLYPPNDRRMVSQALMEDICAGADDFFPYNPSFEALRQVYQVVPGEMMSWPQPSSHQVFNNDEINIGYGTFHGTSQGHRYVLDFTASRYFRDHWPQLHGPVRHDTLAALLRRNAYRVARRLGVVSEPPATLFWACLRLDPAAPEGIVVLDDGPILAECSRVTRDAA